MWQAIDDNWSEILKAFRHRTEHKRYEKDGRLVDSNRPLIESLVDDKIHRRSTFWFYMESLLAETSIKREGRDIFVSCGNHAALGQST